MTTPGVSIAGAGSGEAVIERVVACRSLPTLPSVAAELLELTRDDSATAEDIAKCVEVDQALAVKILKTINSSFYGLATPCPTIARAIGSLGMNSVRSLALSFSLVEAFDGCGREDGFDMAAHWRRAVYGAVAARLAAPAIDWCDPDEAFIGAMLRDIGSLAAAIALGDEYDLVLRETEGTHTLLAPTERERLGVDHAQIGAALAETWRIPPALVRAIELHHAEPSTFSPSSADDSTARCVAFASLAAAACSENEEDARIGAPAFRGLCGDWLGLDLDGIAAFLDELRSKALEATRLFEVETGPAINPSTIMDGAEERRLELQLSQDRESRELEAKNVELERAQRVDGLTGAGNRVALEKAVAEAFSAAKESGEPLAVIFADADRFKALNDEHGHQAGDEALIELSRRLRAVMPGGPEETKGVYRYGGEEFVVIAPGLSVDDAADLGERLRRAVAESPFNLPGDDEPVQVTVSVGVAVLDEATGGAFVSPRDLMNAADKAAYTAKAAGRNVTRLYNHHATLGPQEHAGADEPEPESEPAAPTATEDAPVATVEETGEPERSGAETRGTALRVLVVDDDPMLQKLLSVALEKSGAEVRSVDSVTAAVRLLHFGDKGVRFVPHLIITDLMMPGHSGTKLLRFIRATEGLSTAPVLVLSGSEDEADIRSCLDAGASAYITKAAMSSDPFESARKLVEFWSFAVRAA